MPSVAIVGASNDPDKFGNKAVRAYLRKGWTVYPINPRTKEIAGLATFPTLDDVPHPIDRVAFYVPPEIGIDVLDAVRRKGIPELFLNPGSESDALVARAEALGVNAIQACAIVDIHERP